MSLSKTLYPLLSTCSTQEMSQYDWNLFDWDINHQHKQIKLYQKASTHISLLPYAIPKLHCEAHQQRSAVAQLVVLDLGSKVWYLRITGDNVLCLWASHFILCLALVQPRETEKHPDMTEKLLIACKASTQTKVAHQVVKWTTYDF